LMRTSFVVITAAPFSVFLPFGSFGGMAAVVEN
jgi:hypothetical protein